MTGPKFKADQKLSVTRYGSLKPSVCSLTKDASKIPFGLLATEDRYRYFMYGYVVWACLW